MKRILLALGIGTVVAGTVFGAAASLGGITSTSLGSNDKAVLSCDTSGITTSYNVSYSNADNRYNVDSVAVGGLAEGCQGKKLTVMIADVDGDKLGESAVTTVIDDDVDNTNDIAQTFAVVAVSGAGVSAQAAENVSVVVNG